MNHYIRSEESRVKMREAAKHRLPISDKTKEKMSLAHTGKKISEIHRQKLIAASHTPEAIEKRKQAMIGTKRPKEVCEKIGRANIGMHCYTDGEITVKAKNCPQGFRPGITRKKKSCTNSVEE